MKFLYFAAGLLAAVCWANAAEEAKPDTKVVCYYDSKSYVREGNYLNNLNRVWNLGGRLVNVEVFFSIFFFIF